MKVTVSFLSAPNAVRAVGAKTIAFEFGGGTISDLVRALAERYGADLARYLLDDSGRLDQSFRVVHNTGEWLSRDGLDRALSDGDQVTIVMLVGGG